tara:strand:- start:1373 stop:2167 length:795 start_codon:yes stop_codon:yes gene_type:complete
MIFAEEYIPKEVKDCSILDSRKKFKNKKNKNVILLLEKRFSWMRSFLKNKKNIIELGSGNGASKEILKNKKIILTDIQKYPWINKKIDMTKLDLGRKLKGKVDVFIINHSLHHCSNPSKLLKKMSKYLKKNGLILINDPEISFFFKFFLYILKHEGWSFKVNIFNLKKNIFRSDNPWSANNAVANLLFKDENKFNFYFPEYEIIKNDLSEFLIFINSGGVVNNTFHIPVNKLAFNLLCLVDKVLIKMFPKIFALNRSVILKKIN